MSTKTTFKRIALVAVAALGLGVLSVAPSSAQVSSAALTVTNGTAGNSAVTALDTTTAASVNFKALFGESMDTVTLQLVRKSAPVLDSGTRVLFAISETGTAGTTVDSIANVPAVSFKNAVATSSIDSKTVTGSTVSASYTITGGIGYKDATFGLFFDTGTAPAAGTYTWTVIATAKNQTGAITGTTLADVSLVVTAAANTSKVANAATSKVVIGAGTSTPAETDADAAVSALATASTTAKATLGVYLRNAALGYAQESVTATITGPGLVGDGTTFGKSVVLVMSSATVLPVYVRSDGTAGSASVVIKSDSVTFAAKTITFYAAAAKTITAATNKPVISVSSNSAVVYAKAVDANGAAWGGTAYIYAASAADALIAGSETPVACTYVASDDVHACPVTGKLAGTANFKVIDAATVAAATATSNSVAVKVSVGTPATVKLAFNKATYGPGEKAQVWVTALDSAGNALPEQTIANLFATGGITSSTAFSAGSDTLTATFANIQGATSATSGTVAGYHVYTVYMPMASGTVTISATGGTGLATAGRVAVSASAEVVNTSVDAATDAANEATDAANAATDAALAAADAADAATAAAQDASDAVAALSASVSKMISNLRAQITSLTNLVIKIQKKVRA